MADVTAVQASQAHLLNGHKQGPLLVHGLVHLSEGDRAMALDLRLPKQNTKPTVSSSEESKFHSAASFAFLSPYLLAVAERPLT